MITPFLIDRSHSSRPWVVFEVETAIPQKKTERFALDVAIAIELNAQFYGIIRRAWSRFHETLIQEAERGNREHDVRSQRHRELESSYNEAIRLSLAQRQAVHIKMVEPKRLSNRHLDFPV